jgi:iron complex outermembrane recepter protein
LLDFRQSNYGRVNVEGLDFNVNYRTTTSFGGIDAGLSGNYLLSRTSQTGIGAPIVDELRAYVLQVPTGSGSVTLSNNANSRFYLQATLGADIGHFRAQVTLNHTAGYDLVRCDQSSAPNPVCNPSATAAPTQSGLPQDRVGAFNTVNLFFKYDVPSESALLNDLSLSLNINNLFDQDPSVYRLIGASTPGYANGFTLGRLIQFGIQKKF